MKRTNLLNVFAVILAMSVTGCGKSSGGGGEYDPDKANLYIITYEGGVGDQWIKNAAKIFEEKNKDRTDFEEGKTGVKVHVKSGPVGGTSLLNTDLDQDIYFTESIDYYGMTNRNKMADITDVVTASNPEDDNKKIIDKIDTNMVNFMNRGNKYYAVPFYDCFYSLLYDKDLFREQKLYMKDDGSWTNKVSEFGTGPNGVSGDWDDGLPKTYAQFGTLLDMMRNKNIIPFVYVVNPEMSFYSSRTLMSYWADDEGFDDANLNYTFDGTAHHIVTSISGGVAQTEEVAISKNNGYLLRKQAGLYNALSFADKILCSTTANYQGSSTFKTAQKEFVANKYIGGSVKPYGMIFEGTWFENEARDAFDFARSFDPEAEFNFGIMPIPKSNDSKVGQKATFLNLNESYGFINAKSKQMKLAKEFFSFVHTDEQLRAFTVETGMTRALDYSLTSAQYAAASTFTKDLISIKQSEHVNILYPCSGLDFVINNSSTFTTQNWLWSTNGDQYNKNPVMEFIDANSSVTSEQYFWSHVADIDQEKWNRIIKAN